MHGRFTDSLAIVQGCLCSMKSQQSSLITILNVLDPEWRRWSDLLRRPDFICSERRGSLFCASAFDQVKEAVKDRWQSALRIPSNPQWSSAATHKGNTSAILLSSSYAVLRFNRTTRRPSISARVLGSALFHSFSACASCSSDSRSAQEPFVQFVQFVQLVQFVQFVQFVVNNWLGSR